MIRLLSILVLLLMCSCRSIQYVPVETVRTDSLYINKVQRDSVIVRDSVYVREKGDTVYLYKYKYIYKDRIATDTIFVNRTDTIRVPVEVERKPTFWQNLKSQIQIIIFIVLVLIGLVVIRKAVRMFNE